LDCGDLAALAVILGQRDRAPAIVGRRRSRPLVLIVGMLSTKDTEGFLRNFASLARCLIAVPVDADSHAWSSWSFGLLRAGHPMAVRED
jgi:hypothetical protein